MPRKRKGLPAARVGRSIVRGPREAVAFECGELPNVMSVVVTSGDFEALLLESAQQALEISRGDRPPAAVYQLRDPRPAAPPERPA